MRELLERYTTAGSSSSEREWARLRSSRSGVGSLSDPPSEWDRHGTAARDQGTTTRPQLLLGAALSVAGIIMTVNGAYEAAVEPGFQTVARAVLTLLATISLVHCAESASVR